MLNFSKFFLFLIKFLLILIILAKLSLSYADQLRIEKVKINGAKRLSESFILNFLPEYPNTNFNNEVLNKFTKDIETFRKLIEFEDEKKILNFIKKTKFIRKKIVKLNQP